MISVREYKFKIWNLVEKKMLFLDHGIIYNANPEFNPDDEVTASNCPYFLEFWEEPLIPCVIMQFTGRRDMKGVDIYDLDIIKRHYKEFDFDTNEHNAKEQVSYVEYLDRGFWIKDESFGWEGENLWDWNKIEVIGNLFETPERYYLEK